MEIGESAVTPAAEMSPELHAVLRIKSVTFAGNHPVEQDTTGHFAPPEWLRGRSRQWPVCYTRGRNVRLRARFDVLVVGFATETVNVRARMVVGSAALEWTGSVQVGPADAEVVTAELTSSGPLPNEVACYDPAEIEFWTSAAGQPFRSAGSSRNVFYVVLGDPAGTPPYWTLLDISCRGAAGATTAADVIRLAYRPFTGLQLTRKRDGRGLTYWAPDTTTATNTAQLLARGDGAGQCGSWAEFLSDMYKAHGIGGALKVAVARSLTDWSDGITGFLVKNWTFVGAGSHRRPFTHEMWTECRKLPGIPGQRNPDPPPGFFNHFIVRAGGQLYDPSYGGGPIANHSAWEVGAIDGLFASGYAGYPKSNYPTQWLLQFYDATTLQLL